MIRYVKCDRCDKTGKVHAGSAYGQKFESVCPKCDGEGIIDLLTKSQWQIHKERIFLFTFLLTLVLGALLVAMTSQVVFVIVLSIGISAFLFIQSSRSTLMFSQFVFASSTLFGALLLAFDKKKTNIIGWLLYFISHVLCVDLMIKTDSYVIALFQILSALIAMNSMYLEYKRK